MTDNITVNSPQNGTVVGAVKSTVENNGKPADLGFRTWTPIGQDGDGKYTGTFDGNGKTISGLYYYGSTSAGTDDPDAYVGLFGSVGSATIRDLTIADSYLQGSYNVGTFVGRTYGDPAITGCHSQGGYIKGHESNNTSIGALRGVGGIVGYAYSQSGTPRIEDCSNSSEVIGYWAGGILGNGGYSGNEIRRCMNAGTISATNDRYGYAGGIAGMSAGTVEYCYNTGDVSGRNACGVVADENVVKGCYNTGDVSGTNAGPIVVSDSEKVTACCYVDEAAAADGTDSDGLAGTTAISENDLGNGRATWLLNGGQPKTYDPEKPETATMDLTLEIGWKQRLASSGASPADSYPVFAESLGEGEDGLVCYTEKKAKKDESDKVLTKTEKINGIMVESVVYGDTLVPNYYNRSEFDFDQLIVKDATYTGGRMLGYANANATEDDAGSSVYKDPYGDDLNFGGGFTREYSWKNPETGKYETCPELVGDADGEASAYFIPTEVGDYEVTLSFPNSLTLKEGEKTFRFSIKSAQTKLELDMDAIEVSCASVTLDEATVTPSAHEGEVLYGYATEDDPGKVGKSVWQKGTTFAKLKNEAGVDETYYFFAKIGESKSGTAGYDGVVNCTDAVTSVEVSVPEHGSDAVGGTYLEGKTDHYTGDTYCKGCKTLLDKGHAIIPDQDGDGEPEPDKDGDGIYEGTRDEDGDGQPDNTYIPDQDGDGIPEADDDGDGIYDGTRDEDGDGQPDNAYIPDQDGDGIPEADDDGDGIYDNAAGDKHYIPDGKGGFELVVLAYSFLDDGLTWAKGGTEDMTFTVDAPAEKFSQLSIGGKAVDPESYTYASGSTVITLEAEYLNGLNVGNYNVAAEYVDGSAATTLNVIEKDRETGAGTGSGAGTDAAGGDGANTGDDSGRMIGFMLLLQVLCIVTVCMLMNKKRIHR